MSKTFKVTLAAIAAITLVACASTAVQAQPPLIPHTIENYEISATENACWDCHNSDDFKGKKMPMVGKSHLIGPVVADVTPKLNMQRWQCDSCHVPQVDAQPLVDNVFQGNISRK